MNVLILGTRGIPAQYGGFETFAESLSLFLVARGHSVVVYCQSDIEPTRRTEFWNGIELVHIYGGPGAAGTIRFDFLAALDAAKRPGIVLTLGYNTAIFSLFYWLRRRPSLMNMDGIEWKREKWSFLERLWLRLNEQLGARLSSHLIADHPAIAAHLQRIVSPDKITMIPYGAHPTKECCARASTEPLATLGLTPREYALIIARPEPENSLIEMVTAFSSKERGIKLVILGTYNPKENKYHQKVMDAASTEILFAGPIYKPSLLTALRHNALFYLHGHRVGGTNPALVEALATSNAILAHDNVFNAWVAGTAARYFRDTPGLVSLLDSMLEDKPLLDKMREASRVQHEKLFLQYPLLEQYEALLERFS